MLDKELRRLKDIILVPAANAVGNRVHPITITGIGFFIGIGSVVLLYLGCFYFALGLWILNRILDGLDGLVARQSGRKSDLGGFLDLAADFFIYAAIPLVVAFHYNDVFHYAVTALLLAAFYINASLWMSVSAILEKHNCREDKDTSLFMPRGLVEGFETIIFYSFIFIFPFWYPYIALTMVAVMVVGIVIRLFQSIGLIRRMKN